MKITKSIDNYVADKLLGLETVLLPILNERISIIKKIRNPTKKLFNINELVLNIQSEREFIVDLFNSVEVCRLEIEGIDTDNFFNYSITGDDLKREILIFINKFASSKELIISEYNTLIRVISALDYSKGEETIRKLISSVRALRNEMKKIFEEIASKELRQAIYGSNFLKNFSSINKLHASAFLGSLLLFMGISIYSGVYTLISTLSILVSVFLIEDDSPFSRWLTPQNEKFGRIKIISKIANLSPLE